LDGILRQGAVAVLSIIIPTYNRASLLNEALISLQNQSLQDWEAIVVDDASTDGSLETLQTWTVLDRRIHCYPRPQEIAPGAPACRNYGTQQAQGNYIIYLDSDDYLGLDCLQSRYEWMESHPDLDFAVFPSIFFQQRPGDLRQLWNIPKPGEDDLARLLRWDSPWQTSSVIWRKSALDRIGLWDEQLPSLQDFDLNVRALMAGLKYQWVDRPDCFWRMPHTETIGNRMFSPDHLRSHGRLFANLRQELIGCDRWNQHYQSLMGGLAFMLMDAWAYRDYAQEAQAVWQQSYQEGLLPKGVYQQGQCYIRMSCQRGLPRLLRRMGRKLLNQWFAWTWPKGLHWSLSPTIGHPMPSHWPMPRV
jgi:glycosyltransferase involved in cell wall biosynthesis